MKSPFRKVRVIEEHYCSRCNDRELRIYTTTPAEYWLRQNWTILLGFQLYIGYLVGFALYHVTEGTPKVFRGVFSALVAFAIAVAVARICIAYVPYIMVVQVVLCLLTAGVSMYKSYKEFGWL